MKTRSFITLFFTLFVLSNAAAGGPHTKYDFPIVGTALMDYLSSPVSVTVEAPGIASILNTLNTPQKRTKFQNTIELVLNNQSDLDEDAKVKVDADITYYKIDGSAGIPVSISLEVDFKSGALQKSNISNIYAFTNAYRVVLTVTNVLLEGATGFVPIDLQTKVESFIELVISFQEESYDRIDYNTVVSGLTHCKDVGPDELIIKWNSAQYAEEYELEYTYVDDYTENYSTAIPPAYIKYDFKNNSTRISLKDTYYRFPLLYEKGWILFRVRAIGKGGPNLDLPVYCKWSGSSENGFVSNFPDKFKHSVAHVTDKMNYQVTSTFVEHGKRSDVVNYFDGTFRSRQTVTGTNLEKKTITSPGPLRLGSCDWFATEKEREIIAGETIYDFQGRPTLNILPAPTNATKIAYIKLLNISDHTKKPYSWEDFDKQSFSCNLSKKLDANLYNGLMGASSYYSEKNPKKSGFNAFIPDAHGYPFTQLTYTPDNTGRVSVQGGLDEIFQLGNGHETRYLYGAPNQTELDRMFGTEVGDSKRYQKNAVMDQNGQVSVTYINPEGKTIATSLAGKKPDYVDALPEYDEALNNQNNTITVSLLNKNVINTIDKTIITEHQFLVTSDNTKYIFDYEIDPQILNASKCDNTPVCLDCIYDIDITLTHVESCTVDPMVICSGTIGKLLNNLEEPDLDCNGTGKYPCDYEKYLNVGTYVLTKKITVNKQAGIDYVNEVFKDTCKVKWQQILDEELDRVDTMDCFNSCLDCEQPPVQTPDCNTTYCSPNPNRCEIMKGMMLADVSPGGQYAQFDRLPDGSINASQYMLSIFNPGNVLPTQNKSLSSILSLLPPGTNILDYTSLINNWRPEFADKFLELHPEFCMTGWCGEPGIEDALDYDVELLTANYYSDAIRENRINPSMPNLATQLLELDPWFLADPQYKTDLKNLLLQYGCGITKKPVNEIAMEMAYCAFMNPPPALGSGTPQMNDPSIPPCSPIIPTSHIFGSDNTPPAPGQNSLADLEWTFLRALYLSAKNTILQRSMDKYAFNNQCDNKCIGESFNWGNSTWSTSQSYEPCDMTGTLYSDKEIRFGSENKNTFQAVQESGISINLSGVDLNDPCQITNAVINQSGNINQQFATVYCGDTSKVPCEISTGLTTLINSILAQLNQDSTLGLTLSGQQLPQSVQNAGITGVTASRGNNRIVINFSPCGSFVELTYLHTNSGIFPPVSVCCITNISCPNSYCNFNMKVTYADNTIKTVHLDTKCNFLKDCKPEGGNVCSQPSSYSGAMKDYLNAIFQYYSQSEKVPTSAQLLGMLPLALREKNGKPAKSVKVDISRDFSICINYYDEPVGNGRVTSLEVSLKSSREKFPGESQEKFKGKLKEVPKEKPKREKRESCCIILHGDDKINSWSDVTKIISIMPDYSTASNGITNGFIARLQSGTGKNTTTSEVKCNSSCWAVNQCPPEFTLCDSLPKMPDYPYANNCVDALIATAFNNTSIRYNEWLDSMKNDLLEKYYAKCLTAVETLNMTYTDLQYHYTLYYYDQAGNLAKTIPPSGVNFLDASRIIQTDNSRKNNYNQTVLPTHHKYTVYRYNTLNELLWQETPDAGESNFYYDALGRISASQNAEQNLNGDFSYTRYDEQGRNVESGEISNNSINHTATRNYDNWNILINSSSTRTEITLTKYDETTQPIEVKFGSTGQNNLRKRAASIFKFDNDDNFQTYIHATHFSYDIMGNVNKLIQDYPNSIIGDKTIDYSYDLQSGKVNSVTYQAGAPDQFIHKYFYDGINRLLRVKTSTNGLNYETDAEYFYYRHGPLARTELGTDKVQGLDYLYTLQGWIKGVNGITIAADTDMGLDGYTGSSTGPGYGALHKTIAQDAFGYVLDFFNNDYKSISPNTCLSGINQQIGKPLYNGNISRMYTQIQNLGNTGFNYTYDQLNRFISQDGWKLDGGSMQPLGDAYLMSMKYDPDGNILNLNRNGSANIPQMDELKYLYYKNDNTNTYDPLNGIPIDATNKLAYVKDNQSLSGNYAEDIDDQQSNNYRYDEIGNLISDDAANISQIEWNLQNKIKKITKTDGTILDFQYDVFGNRVMKGITSNDPTKNKKSFYVRDAQGNVMTLYSEKPDPDDGGNLKLYWDEAHIYGSSRIGIYTPELKLDNSAIPDYSSTNRGYKQYELSNHLGNLLTTITDRKLPVTQSGSTTYKSEISTSQDYYPFGMMMPGRTFSSGNYKFGFNGKENDNEVKGEGNQQDYGMRSYDPRLAKFLSIDPLTKKYPWYTPYQFSSNNPILSVDLDGMEGTLRFISFGTTTALSPQNAQAVVKYTGELLETLGKGIYDLGTGIYNLAATEGTGIYNAATVYGPQTFGFQGLTPAQVPTSEGFKDFGGGEHNEIVKNSGGIVGTTIVGAIGAEIITPIAGYGFGWIASKTAVQEINLTINGVSASRLLLGKTPGKVAVVGRNMNRVRSFAEGIKAEVWNGFDLTLSKAENLANNKKWVQGLKDEGYSVYDVGLDPDFSIKGDFSKGDYYEMETKELFGE